MNRTLLRIVPAVLAAVLAGAARAEEGPVLELELGAAWQDRNVVQAPNDASGTRFSLGEVTGSGPFFAPRLQLSTGLAPRQELRFVVAPLRIKESGSLQQEVDFEGKAFAAGPAEATYRFDSYRATWRMTLYEDADWTWKFGVTGNVRDAEITLRQGGVTSTRKDTGLVPLLHVYGERRLDARSRLAFEGDGLASGQGRAFDLSLRYLREVGARTSAFAGLRLLDGGADNSSIYAFARFYYLTAGLQYRL